MASYEATASILNQVILGHWAGEEISAPLGVLFPLAQSDDRRVLIHCGAVSCLDDMYAALNSMASNFQRVPSEVPAVIAQDIRRLYEAYGKFRKRSNDYLDASGDPEQYRILGGGNGTFEFQVTKTGFTIDLLDASIPERQATFEARSVPDVIAHVERFLGLVVQQDLVLSS